MRFPWPRDRDFWTDVLVIIIRSILKVIQTIILK